MSLTAVIGLVLGLALGGSLLLLSAAFMGWKPPPRAGRSRRSGGVLFGSHAGRRAWVAVVAGVLVAVVTRWPVAAGATMAMIYLWPTMFGGGRAAAGQGGGGGGRAAPAGGGGGSIPGSGRPGGGGGGPHPPPPPPP